MLKNACTVPLEAFFKAQKTAMTKVCAGSLRGPGLTVINIVFYLLLITTLLFTTNAV